VLFPICCILGVATPACNHQYGVEGTYFHLTNELYAIASNSNYDGHVTTGVEHDDVFRVNKSLLIGLQAFKRVQLSLRLTVRTLTRHESPSVIDVQSKMDNDELIAIVLCHL
jgi:hypothetical protein